MKTRTKYWLFAAALALLLFAGYFLVTDPEWLFEAVFGAEAQSVLGE